MRKKINVEFKKERDEFYKNEPQRIAGYCETERN